MSLGGKTGLGEGKQVFTRRFRIGIALIVGSLLCGYASLAVLGGAVGADSPWLRNLSATVWVLTWIPFLVGFALCGKEGLEYAKDIINKYILRRSVK